MITNLRLNADNAPNLIASIECPIFHRAVDLHFCPELHLDRALSCVQQWQDRAQSLYETLASAIWCYARAVCKALGSVPPKCKNHKDIFNYTNLKRIYLVLNDAGLAELLFDLECSWHLQDGLGWAFTSGDIRFVGSALDLFQSPESPSSNYIPSHCV
jgi:hypothetical protein